MRDTGTISRLFFTEFGNIDQILGVFFGDQHLLQPAAQGRQQLFLQAADRQHPAAQRDFAGHGDVAMHRNAGEDRDDGGGHGHARRRAVLGRRAFRHVHVDVATIEHRRLDAEITARERT